jgi:hypothetical protein
LGLPREEVGAVIGPPVRAIAGGILGGIGGCQLGTYLANSF